MKFSLSICVLILCSVAAQAQQIATTADGKKVILNTDGTWKYAEAPSGVTLKIEAGLTYEGGGAKPVARRTFSLLVADPEPELMELPRATEYRFTGLQQLAQGCWRDYPEATAIVRKYARYTVTTGFDGKAELSDIKPGKYWLFGQIPAQERCVTWLMEIDLTKDQNMMLDQHSAR